MSMFESSYSFELPSASKSIIKVIGVGGGGSNAVSYMYNQGIKDVDFVVVNTDIQALRNSPVPNKVQIGSSLTEGLGAGANPEKGRDAALESESDIREVLGSHTKMVFVTAGMGGGTGTGAAPVIAKIAREMNILTVGIVTAPFSFEGPRKRKQADLGIEELKKNCDTVLIILNDKLRQMFGDMRMTEAFAQADTVLTTGAKGIAEIITLQGVVNVDFEDVKTVMKNAGTAVMGSSYTKGENRALRAAEEAIASPLLNSRDILGAQRILLSIFSSKEHELHMSELTEITEYIQSKAGQGADLIYGHGIDESMGEHIRVTVIATGFEKPYDSEEEEEFGKPNKFVLQPTGVSPTFELDPVVHAPAAVHAGGVAAPVATLVQAEAKPVVVEEAPKVVPVPVQRVLDFGPPAAPAPVPAPQHTIEHLVPPTPPARTMPTSPTQPANLPRSPHARPHVINQAQTDAALELQRKRQALLEQGEERRRRLSEYGRPQADAAQLDVPAYMRHNVNLEETAVHVVGPISRYSLSDDQDLVGNNKFLHDNVD